MPTKRHRVRNTIQVLTILIGPVIVALSFFYLLMIVSHLGPVPLVAFVLLFPVTVYAIVERYKKWRYKDTERFRVPDRHHLGDI